MDNSNIFISLFIASTINGFLNNVIQQCIKILLTADEIITMHSLDNQAVFIH